VRALGAWADAVSHQLSTPQRSSSEAIDFTLGGVLALYAVSVFIRHLETAVDRFDLLVLDDLSCVPRNQVEAPVLFEVIVGR